MKFQKRALSMLNDTLFMAHFSSAMIASVVYNSKSDWFELSIESNAVKVTREVRYSYAEKWQDSEHDREDLKLIIRDLFDIWIRKSLEKVK